MAIKRLCFIVSVFIFLATLPSFAAAKSHTNTSHDYEVHIVYYATGGVLVPFTVGVDMKMDITVNYPGKIITYESIYAYILKGALLPFNCRLSVGPIKYYKDGAYLSTHSLKLTGPYYANPSNITSFKYGKPNSNLSEQHTYKAVGQAMYSSTSTTPMSFIVDTTEGVVD